LDANCRDRINFTSVDLQSPQMTQFYVYILATRKDGLLYTGVTSDLRKRIFVHRSRAAPGFTARFKVNFSG
jgi:predicted GIY-YIG superfamily endonuclease